MQFRGAKNGAECDATATLVEEVAEGDMARWWINNGAQTGVKHAMSLPGRGVPLMATTAVQLQSSTKREVGAALLPPVLSVSLVYTQNGKDTGHNDRGRAQHEIYV